MVTIQYQQYLLIALTKKIPTGACVIDGAIVEAQTAKADVATASLILTIDFDLTKQKKHFFNLTESQQ